MAELNQVVNVNVTRETAAAQQAGFGIGMFLGIHKTFTEPFIVVNTLNEVLDAGFSTTSPEYKAASLYFGQDVSPVSLYLGRTPTNDVTTVTCQPASGAGITFTVTLTDSVGATESFTHTSAGSETNIQVATALTALINAGTPAITADDAAGDGTFTLTPDVAASDYSVTTTTPTLVSFTNAISGTLTDAVNDLREKSKDWYLLMNRSHLAADILELAAWTETQKMLYAFATSSADDKTTALTGIMAQLKDLGYDNTYSLYDDEAGELASIAEAYSEAAWAGKMLPKAPGSSNWAYQTLDGVDTLNDEGYPELTTTESVNVLAKNGNTYEQIAGLNVTRYGKVASGEFIDIIRGIHWLEARLSERVFNLLINNDKISYTNADVAKIEADIRAQLDEAITVGLIDGSVDYTITVPDVLTANPADRANRILPPIKFTARLAGAINYVEIQGSVTV